MDLQLKRILAAREERWNMRNELARSNPRCTVLSMTICLPLAYRVSSRLQRLFPLLSRDFENLIAASGIAIDKKTFLSGFDGDAALWVVQGRGKILKRFCVDVEESHPTGRILDIDVMDHGGGALDRCAIGGSPRKCFVCDNRAAVCCAGKTHGVEQLSYAIGELLGAAEKFYR